MNFELIKQGYLPVDIKFSDRAKYYGAFDKYQEGFTNPMQFLELIVKYEEKELNSLFSMFSLNKPHW